MAHRPSTVTPVNEPDDLPTITFEVKGNDPALVRIATDVMARTAELLLSDLLATLPHRKRP